jgi:hypothetical protein
MVTAMKVMLAIICSLWFVCSQTFALTTSQIGGAETSCCGCGKNCCVTKSPSESQPQPAAPGPVQACSRLTSLPAQSLIWLQPLWTASKTSFSFTESAQGRTVPIFLQNCSLVL